MNFTFHEVDGDKPISGWIAVRVVELARTKYGIDVQVSVNGAAYAACSPSDEPFTPNSSLEGHSCSRIK